MISRGATFPRGNVSFNEKTLSALFQDARKTGDIFTSINGDLLARYREYYGLDYKVTSYRAGILRVADESVFLQFFEPQDSDRRKKREYILISHGYYDHAGLYGHLIEHLLSRGWNVAIFDQIGHGLSSGSRAEIQDFDQYVQVLSCVVEHLEKKENQKIRHWIGQSMGCSVLLEYFASGSEKLEGELILLAPLVRPYGWNWLRFYFSLIKHFVKRRPRKFEKRGPNQEFLDLLLNDPLQATILPVNWVQAMVNWFERFEKRRIVFEKLIIVQGLKDKTVSSRHNLSVLKHFCRSIRLLEIPKAKHHLVNETELVRQQLWDWLDITCEWRH